jgi:glutaredoxin
MNKEPYEMYPEIWKSKSAYYTWLRGQIRMMWMHYPAKIKWKQSQAFKPPESYTGRAKKLGTCHYCKEDFGISSLEVDHVQQAGSCNSWENATDFMYKLLDCNDNWVLACKPCHKAKSLSERSGISFDDAVIQKKVIAYEKETDTEQVIAFLKENGYTTAQCSNAKKRRLVLTEVFSKE